MAVQKKLKNYCGDALHISSVSILFDADIDGHHRLCSGLIHPVTWMRVADDLAQSRMAKIQRLASIIEALPAQTEQIDLDLPWMRMSPFDVLHAGNQRWLAICGDSDPVEPNIQSRHEPIQQPQRIQINGRSILIPSKFAGNRRFEHASFAGSAISYDVVFRSLGVIRLTCCVSFKKGSSTPIPCRCNKQPLFRLDFLSER